MKNTVEFLPAQRTRIEVQDPYLGTGKFPDSDNPQAFVIRDLNNFTFADTPQI